MAAVPQLLVFILELSNFCQSDKCISYIVLEFQEASGFPCQSSHYTLSVVGGVCLFLVYFQAFLRYWPPVPHAVLNTICRSTGLQADTPNLQYFEGNDSLKPSPGSQPHLRTGPQLEEGKGLIILCGHCGVPQIHTVVYLGGTVPAPKEFGEPL